MQAEPQYELKDMLVTLAKGASTVGKIFNPDLSLNDALGYSDIVELGDG